MLKYFPIVRERLEGELDKLSHNGKRDRQGGGTGRRRSGNWERRDDKITATLASLFN